MPEQRVRATDDRKSDLSREVWQARDDISTEGRAEARNVIIVAGALAAFTMAAFGDAQGIATTLSIGIALIAFLVGILVGVLQMAHNLWSTHSAYSNLILWLDDGDQDARLRYDAQKARWKKWDKKKGTPFSTPEICLAVGIVFLIASVVLSIAHRQQTIGSQQENEAVQQAGSTVPTGARGRAPAVP